MKILVIEDEQELGESICRFLSDAQYTCERASDFSTALEKIHLHEYACILLDINLPGGSGLEILNELKRQNKTDGVLVISARNALDDRLTALHSGADDYLAKPFHLTELGARVAAIIRRRSFGGNNIIQLDELVVNIDLKSVTIDNKEVELTRKEYDMLLYFIGNRNKVVTKNAIAEHLWGDSMEGAGSHDFIYTHIKNLRKKLTSAGCRDFIKSVYGLGYKFIT